jgi:hypothetical protein
MMTAGLLFAVLVTQAQGPDPELLVRIGSLDGAEATTFGSIADIAVSRSGHIFVLERQAHGVRVFGADGEHRFSYGRRGEGPGELNNPITLEVSDGEILVLNAAGSGVRFLMNGEYVDNERFSFGTSWSARFGPDAFLVTTSASASSARLSANEALLLIEAGGTDTLASGPSSDILARNEHGSFAYRSPFCGLLHVAAPREETVAVAFGESGVVARARRGLQGWEWIDSVRVSSEAQFLTDKDYARILDRLPARFEVGRDDLTTADVRSQICGLESAPDGKVWVRVENDSARELWRRLDFASSQAVSELVFPDGVRILAFGNDSAVGVWRDEFDVPYVVVYAVR